MAGEERKEGIRVVATYRCDLRCGYCYQKEFGGARLDPSRMREALERLGEGIGRVTLMGGEISLIPGALRYALEARSALPGARLSVTSNGSGREEFYRGCLEAGAKVALSEHGRLFGESGEEAAPGGPLERLAGVARAFAGRVRINAYWDGGERRAAGMAMASERLGMGLTFCAEMREEEKPDPERFLARLKEGGLRGSGWEIVRADRWRWGFRRGGEERFSLFARDARLDRSEWIVLPSGEVTDRLEDLWEGAGARGGRRAEGARPVVWGGGKAWRGD